MNVYILTYLIFPSVGALLFTVFIRPVVYTLIQAMPKSGSFNLFTNSTLIGLLAVNVDFTNPIQVEKYSYEITQLIGLWAFLYALFFAGEADILKPSLFEAIPRLGWWIVLCVFTAIMPNAVALGMRWALHQFTELGDDAITVFAGYSSVPFYAIGFYGPLGYLSRLETIVHHGLFDDEGWQ